MYSIASSHYRIGKYRQPGHAHDEGHGVPVLQLGVVHIRDGHPQQKLHGELQPLRPLHHEGEAALVWGRVRGTAALLLEGVCDGSHPGVQHGRVSRDELQRHQATQVRVVLVDVQRKVFLVTRRLAVQHVLQRDDLHGGLLETGKLQRRRPRNRHGAPRGLIQQWARLALLELHRRPSSHLVVLPHEDRLVDESAVVPVPDLRGAAVLVHVGRGSSPEYLPSLSRVLGGAHKQGIVTHPDVALLDPVVAVHETVADVHPHAQDGALARVGALDGPPPMVDHRWVWLVVLLLLLLLIAQDRQDADLAAEFPAHSPSSSARCLPDVRLRKVIADLR
mmetsp:Transcript_15559/g.46612  ORF Transcript_15559/g.46612 Transcript_15559/m.46612 type:complete len:334 (+) Transcript_15559:517-1518(+)